MNVQLSDGEFEVHYIGVNWPHHIFVDQNFMVVGANWQPAPSRLLDYRITIPPGWMIMRNMITTKSAVARPPNI